MLFPGHDAWSYADAVQRAAPAVVNIYTSRTVTERVQPSGFGAFFGDPAPRYRNRTERSLGSGVIVDTEGHIATNNHVIEDADQVWVQLADHRVAVARVVGRDPDSDLALLKISLGHLPVMPFGHSDQLQVGDVVLAIGNPLGLSQTVTHGIVSATGRGQLGLATFENFIQTDAAINPGQFRRRPDQHPRRTGGHQHRHRGQNQRRRRHRLCHSREHGARGHARPDHPRQGRARLDRHRSGGFLQRAGRRLGLAHGGVVLVDLYPDSPALAAGLRPGRHPHRLSTAQT